MIQLRTKRKLWKQSIRRRTLGCCAACGKTGPLEVDHIIPKSLNGTDNIKNLQFLCRSCNVSKGAKINWMKNTGGERK